MSQMTNVAENDFIDTYIRNQASIKPTSWNIRLYTAAPGETGGGTVANYTNYADVSVVASLANFAGTQSAGSTVASSGSGGVTSNNGVLTFGTTAGSGPQTLVAFAWCATTTPWFYGDLTPTRTLNNGDVAPAGAAAAFTLTAS